MAYQSNRIKRIKRQRIIESIIFNLAICVLTSLALIPVYA